MANRCISGCLVLSFLLLFCFAACSLAGAQTKKNSQQNLAGDLSRDLSEAKEKMVAAAQAYKESLQKLAPYAEADVKRASDTYEKRKLLFGQGIVSKKELQESEQALATAQSKLNEANTELTEADALIAEAMASDQPPDLPTGGYRATTALIRYNGSSAWSLKDAAKVEGFYTGKFGAALPISAFGQTSVHDKLGFDHREAMDIAVQPDSPQGEALMAYLRSQGIPFIAFRHAVPGSATGAHIHVGRPSHRIAPMTNAPVNNPAHNHSAANR